MKRSESSRPRPGKWYEELSPGLVIDHAIRRTLTESDNVLFTSMTMNPAWLHLDFDYAENETEFGQPLVNSMLTLALVVAGWPTSRLSPDDGSARSGRLLKLEVGDR